MEQEDLVVLDYQAQELYMAYQRKFESEDWKQTVEWAKERAATNAVRQLAAKSWDDVNQAKGARNAFEEIIDLESATENHFLNLVAEARASALAVDEGEHE